MEQQLITNMWKSPKIQRWGHFDTYTRVSRLKATQTCWFRQIESHFGLSQDDADAVNHVKLRLRVAMSPNTEGRPKGGLFSMSDRACQSILVPKRETRSVIRRIRGRSSDATVGV